MFMGHTFITAHGAKEPYTWPAEHLYVYSACLYVRICKISIHLFDICIAYRPTYIHGSIPTYRLLVNQYYFRFPYLPHWVAFVAMETSLHTHHAFPAQHSENQFSCMSRYWGGRDIIGNWRNFTQGRGIHAVCYRPIYQVKQLVFNLN